MARNSSNAATTTTVGFEAKLWLAADKLCNNMDAAEYKQAVLGLIFLKYISDTFEEMRTARAAKAPRIRTNSDESRTFATLGDTLHKLLSGELKRTAQTKEVTA